MLARGYRRKPWPTSSVSRPIAGCRSGLLSAR